jgi:type IV fimbrial biogenesis protein FimT
MSDARFHRAVSARGIAGGFTLLELMISVAIIAILAAMVFPSYREFTTRMTVSNNVNELVGALNTARAEAVKRGRTVAVIANGGGWSSGWQVVSGKETAAGTVAPPVPLASHAACTAALDLDGVTPLCSRYADPLADTYTVLGKAAGGGAVDDRVVFGATGALAGSATKFDFSVCRPSSHADTAQSRMVSVAPSGIITTHRDTTDSIAGICS